MKKKRIFVGIAAVVLLLFCAFLFWQSDISYKREEKEFIVGNGVFSHYSYAVYDDHVELKKYLGNDADLVVPDKLLGKPVTVIGEACFEDKEVVTVHLGKNISAIGERAFINCFELKEVVCEAELERIEAATFFWCTGLERVEVGNKIRYIGDSAFGWCKSLESIGEQPDLEYVGEYAFYCGGVLKDLYISESVELEKAVFNNSQWLANKTDEFVIVGNGNLLDYNGAAGTVMIPDGVIRVDGAFMYEDSNEQTYEVYLSKTVKEITLGSFEMVKYVTLYIPESVIRIGESTQEDDDVNKLTYNNATLTIVTTEGSTAQAYAEKYGIKCEIVEGW